MLKLIVVFGLLFAGCAKAPHNPDEYITTNVTVYLTDDAVKICTEMIGKLVYACAKWFHDPERCFIIITKKDVTEDTELLGHEFKHCIEGEFH